MEAAYVILLLVLLVLVVGVIMLYTADAESRGFSRGQVFIIRTASFIFFPFGFLAYLILRPLIRKEI
jgi:cell division protein FtsW (lipid II flippase)